MQFSGAKFVYLHHIIMAILMKGLTIFRRTTKSEGIIVTILFSALTRMFPKPTFAP